MRYGTNYGGYDEDDSQVAYDLRQFRAKLISARVMDCYEREESFPEYFKALQNLFSTVRHALKASIKKTKKEIVERFDSLSADFISKAKRYPKVFAGYHSDVEGYTELRKAAKRIEEFIFEQMENSGLWGTKWQDDGL